MGFFNRCYKKRPRVARQGEAVFLDENDFVALVKAFSSLRTGPFWKAK